jgi:hypothetical protein
MLTTDDTDFRDTLATSVALVCLLNELLMHRRPGGDLCLSPQAADGLTDALHLVRTTLVEAKDRLTHTTANETPP